MTKKKSTKKPPRVKKLKSLDNLTPMKIAGAYGTSNRHEIFKVVLSEWVDKKITVISSVFHHQLWTGTIMEYCVLNDNLDPYHLIKCIRHEILCRVEYPKYEDIKNARHHTVYDSNGVASYLAEILPEDHDRIIVKDPRAVIELSNFELKKYNEDLPSDYSDFSTQYSTHKVGI